MAGAGHVDDIVCLVRRLNCILTIQPLHATQYPSISLLV